MKSIKTLGIAAAVLFGLVVLSLAIAILVYPPEYIFRAMVWQGSDAFDWQKFPSHPLTAALTAYHFGSAPDPRVEGLFGSLTGTDDWNSFLEANDTQAFIVIQDGVILYENYFNGTQKDSIVPSFSVAKSFTSALIGIAIDEGFISSVDDPITNYLPELAERDPRFEEITIRHLLLMASGLEYKAFRPLLLNSDDILTTYYPDQRKAALEFTKIIDPPGVYYRYNKYHPQLLGLILERATGMPVASYLQTRIWDKIGMEFDGSWSTDSTSSDFEKMETGVNARAIDFAKFGVLFLHGGNWQGEQVISKGWVEESTSPLFPSNYSDYYSDWYALLPGEGHYKYMWYSLVRDEDEYDFAAEGDKGQLIYISPHKNLVIVRNGIQYGLKSEEWFNLFYEFASQY